MNLTTDFGVGYLNLESEQGVNLVKDPFTLSINGRVPDSVLH